MDADADGDEPRQVQPWMRQPNETDPAYEAFATYRDMGSGRTGAKVGEELGKSLKLIERWSADNDWVERCRSFDQHIAGVETETYADMVRKVTEQQTTLTDKLFDRLNASLDQLPPGDDPSMRWTQAYMAACRARVTLLDYNKPDAPKSTEVAEKIANIINRLSSDE